MGGWLERENTGKEPGIHERPQGQGQAQSLLYRLNQLARPVYSRDWACRVRGTMKAAPVLA